MEWLATSDELRRLNEQELSNEEHPYDQDHAWYRIQNIVLFHKGGTTPSLNVSLSESYFRQASRWIS